MNIPRIAILNAHWSVHSSVAYMASELVDAGYAVDVFLYRSDENLSGELLDKLDTVRVYRCDPPSSTGRDRSVVEKTPKSHFFELGKSIVSMEFRRRLRRLQRNIRAKLRPEQGIIPDRIVRRVLDASDRDSYVAMIGVEKGGLAWAGMVAEQNDCPIIYYSLELYTRDHPYTRRSDLMKRLKVLEERFHRRCKLTIVQDEHRGKVLLADNRVRTKMELTYLPVSLTGSYENQKSEWLQNELGLPIDTVVILSYGMMNRQRLCEKIARIGQSFPENWRMVFHGYGNPEIIQEIQGADVRNRVSLSLRLVPAEERQRVVSSAQIGLAIYNKDPLNDRLTGLSSEKIAMYLQCGLPLVAFRHQSFEHIEDEGAGVLVDRLEEIPNAIEAILKDYEGYVSRAYASYTKHYCFENNITSVIASIKRTHAKSSEAAVGAMIECDQQ